jgi:4-amino-4-deoxy-L-arabinose transferase-like glycosyltransferase
VSLRIVSAFTAWATVLVILVWASRSFQPIVGLLAALVLSTSFGFIHIHSGRSGNADAPYTLLVVLLIVTLCAEREQPWRRVWLGPIAAGLFLLKGVGVLMPLAIVAGVLAVRRRDGRSRTLPSLAAALLFLAPSGAWAIARWSVDGAAFFQAMWQNDLVRLSTEVLDGHGGTPLFYLDVLQKHHYPWIVAGIAALALFPPRSIRGRLPALRDLDDPALVVVIWAAACLVIPTAMATKLPWYLNPLYPAFAIAVGWLLARGLAQQDATSRERRRLLVVVAVAALCVAEASLIWYSIRTRDVGASVQGVLFPERDRLSNGRVFGEAWSHADTFVVRAIAGAGVETALDLEDFIGNSGPGDFLVGSPEIRHPELRQLNSRGGYALYERVAP